MNLKKLATENKTAVLRIILIYTLILIASALRLAPHPLNFTPVGAIALFAGAAVRNRRLAFLLPLLVMFVTDALTSFNILSPLVYASFLLSVLIGRVIVGPRFNPPAQANASHGDAGLQLTQSLEGHGPQAKQALDSPSQSITNPRKHLLPRIAGATFLGSLQFFLITNFGVWAFLNTYPRTATGLATCYIVGFPLFWNTLAGDATYAALLFGAFFLAERFAPRPRQSVVAGL